MSDENEVVPESNGKEIENNVKDNDTAVQEPDTKKPAEKDDAIDLDAEIVRQVEYYFGDVNLPRDKFLREQTQLEDGWVPLSILTKFNRLSKLSSDLELIENALKKSTSGILEVADKKVRRNPEHPVPEMNEGRRKELMSRTIYAKGFPKNSTLDELLRFFKNFEQVENVIMRRYVDQRTKVRMFKGSVFATFKMKEQAEKFVSEKDTIKYNNASLLIMFQEDYLILKEEEKKEKFNKKRDKKQKQQDKKVIPPKEISLATGTVLYFEDGDEKMTREEIKTAVTKIDKKADIAFIDYKIGLTKGWIRFAQENAASAFLKSLDNGNIDIGEHKVLLKLLEGEEEKAYLKKTHEEMVRRRKAQKMFKKGRNNYKGNSHMKRRREMDNEDAPPAKVKCDS